MRKAIGKLLVMLLIGIIFMVAVGCEEESLLESSKDIKKSRLVAMKNRELQNELTDCKKEIEKLEETIKSTNEGTNAILEFVMTENQKLTKENTELKKSCNN